MEDLEERFEGLVKTFDGTKGFGWVQAPKLTRKVFLHVRQLEISGYTGVVPGEPIEFSVRETEKGLEAVRPTRLVAGNAAIQELIEKLKSAKETEFRLLLVGRGGVGKSATTNTLLGRKVAKEDRFVRGTVDVVPRKAILGGVPCVIIDTPGLCDAEEAEGRDDEYIALMKEKAPDFDCLLYFTPLIEARVRRDEIEAVKIVTAAFGPAVWDRAIIVFTNADRAHSAAEYHEFVKNRSLLLREEITRRAGGSKGSSVPVVPVTNISDTTPDGATWLDNLFATVLGQLRRRAVLPFFLSSAGEGRLSFGPTNEDDASSASTSTGASARAKDGSPNARVTGRLSHDSSPKIVLSETTAILVERQVESVIGAGLVASLGALGLKCGALITGIATAGPGAPIGAAVGALVGVALGTAISFMANLFGRRRRG